MKGLGFTLVIAVVALFILAAHAATIPTTIASEATKLRFDVNPELLAKETKRTKKFQEKLHKMSFPKRFLEDFSDNYDGTAEENYGFDMTQFSIKFNQCATVETYSDEMAQNTESDTVLVAKRFAIFSLCPTDQCSTSDSSSDGCSNNSYGEYVVSLDEYLSALLESEEERVTGFCNYCDECATIETAKAFWKEIESYRENALKTAEANFEDWYSTNVAADEDQYDQANTYNANGNQDTDIAQTYYWYLRNGSDGYASNYYQKNYANQQQQWQAENQWDNSNNNAEYWDFQANYNANDQSQNYQNAWASLGGSSGNFYGYTVVNGYMDENGDFNQEWGYVNCNGEFVSLQDNNSQGWDECLWGAQPAGWDGVTKKTESCNEEYTASCYSQYNACMSILNGEVQLFSIKDFVDCTPVDNPYQMYNENNNNNNNNEESSSTSYYENDRKYYYIGPHCNAGGNQISLAVYQDEYCSILLDSSSSDITVETLLGYTPPDMADNFWVSNECIPCGSGGGGSGGGGDNGDDGDAADETTNYKKWYETQEMNDGDGGNDAIEPMCSTLYQLSGKCLYTSNNNNNNMNTAWWADQDSNNDQAGDDEAAVVVCDFIETLKSNTYDENGQVILVNNSPMEMLARLSTWTKIALAVLALAVVVLCIWACFLHNSLLLLLKKKRRHRRILAADENDNSDVFATAAAVAAAKLSSSSSPGNNPKNAPLI